MGFDVGAHKQVTLRPMTAAEFDAWKEHTITSHAGDVAEATGQPLELALAKTRTQFPKLLPDGLGTAGTW